MATDGTGANDLESSRVQAGHLGIEGPFGVPVPASEESVSLAKDELNLFDATAVAVSSTAPAYSLASAMASLFIIGSVGLHAPAMVILSFIPILFIAYAYFHLNRRNPNCGASYAWLSEVFHPAAGWFNGFIQVGISVIFCVQAPIVAATYTMSFLNSVGWVNASTASSTKLLTIVAVLWLVLITFFCIYGIRWTTNFQWVLCIIEYVAVIVFSVGGIIKVALAGPGHHYTSFSVSWLNPLQVHGLGNLAAAMAVGTFLFWGWDTAVNLNEESKNPSRTPGRAAIISMWLLLLIFVINFVAAEMLLPAKDLENPNANLLFVFGQQFAGNWAGYILIFAVLSSTVATTQTTLLPAARITYSMSRDHVFPKLFATIHPKTKTPALGTAILGILALVGIVVVNYNSTAGNIIATFTLNVGALVAFYYGATGVACAWAFRKAWRESAKFTLLGIALPLLGGIVLLVIFGYDLYTGGWSGMKWDIMLLIISAVLTPIVWFTKRDVPFFNQPMVSYDTIEQPVAVG